MTPLPTLESAAVCRSGPRRSQEPRLGGCLLHARPREGPHRRWVSWPPRCPCSFTVAEANRGDRGGPDPENAGPGEGKGTRPDPRAGGADGAGGPPPEGWHLLSLYLFVSVSIAFAFGVALGDELPTWPLVIHLPRIWGVSAILAWVRGSVRNQQGPSASPCGRVLTGDSHLPRATCHQGRHVVIRRHAALGLRRHCLPCRPWGPRRDTWDLSLLTSGALASPHWAAGRRDPRGAAGFCAVLGPLRVAAHPASAGGRAGQGAGSPRRGCQERVAEPSEAFGIFLLT